MRKRKRSLQGRLDGTRTGLLRSLMAGAVWLVLAGAAAGSASAAVPGSLAITTTGLPAGQRPSILVSGPKYHRVLTSDRTILRSLRAGRYALTVKIVVAKHRVGHLRAGAVAYPAKRRLSVEVKPGSTARLTVLYAALINPGVRRLPAHVLGILGKADDPSGIVLPGRVGSPSIGTIFTSGPTTMLPMGLISKVTRTRHRSGRIVVSLVSVPTTEAVPELSFTGSLPLTPEGGSVQQVGSSIPAETASIRSAHASQSCGPPNLLKFGANLDHLELREAFLGAWPPQMKLTLAARTTETLGVGVAAVGIKCDWDLHEIGPYSAGVPIGPIVVPVYATLPLKAALHVSGTLEAGAINVASTTVAHAAAGWDETDASLEEQGSNEWLSGSPSVSGSVELSSSIGIQAGIGIAKDANLHLEAGFGPEFDWSSGNDCELFIDLGSLSAGVEAFDHSLDTPAFTPFKLHLWKGCQPPASPPPSPPPPPHSSPPPVKSGIPAVGPTLVYDANTAGQADEGDTSFTDWANATGQEANVQETLPAELNGYKCVALLLNQSIEPASTEALVHYVKEGGTIVVIGEHEGPGWSSADIGLNEFLASAGASISIDDDSLDEGPYVTSEIESSPFTSGVSYLGYNWISSASVSGDATPLVLTADGSEALVAAQSVGNGTLIVSGDSNMFSDNSESDYEDDDNGQFVRDICP